MTDEEYDRLERAREAAAYHPDTIHAEAPSRPTSGTLSECGWEDVRVARDDETPNCPACLSTDGGGR